MEIVLSRALSFSTISSYAKLDGGVRIGMSRDGGWVLMGARWGQGGGCWEGQRGVGVAGGDERSHKKGKGARWKG